MYNSGFSNGMLFGSFVVAVLLIFLFAIVGKPTHRAYGFKLGACTVACGDLTPKLQDEECFCEEANKNRVFKPIPKYPE